MNIEQPRRAAGELPQGITLLITRVTTLLAASLLSAAASAGTGTFAASPSSAYYVSAPVLEVDPITTLRTIRHPVRQCTSSSSYREENYHDAYHDGYERRRSDENHFWPGLLGGIVGGLVGNQFGGGSGKKALTVVGALAGSSIARNAARRRSRHDYHEPAKICKTTYETETVEEVSAYDVTYAYSGQQFSKRMTEHPGDSVRVRVELSPEINHD